MTTQALLNGFGNPGITGDAVNFDGTNDQMNNSTPSGFVNGKTGIFSCWLKLGGGDGVQQIFWNDNVTGQRIQISRTTGNNWQIVGKNSAGTTILALSSSGGTLAVTGGWRHILASWDLVNTLGKVYVDDVDLTVATTLTNDTIVYSSGLPVQMGGNSSNAARLNADVAEFYLAYNQFLDFSFVANRRKFWLPSLHPVNLGADGSLPTGVQPTAYFRCDKAASASTFATNLGSCGNMTIVGALTTSGTNPY